MNCSTKYSRGSPRMSGNGQLVIHEALGAASCLSLVVCSRQSRQAPLDDAKADAPVSAVMITRKPPGRGLRVVQGLTCDYTTWCLVSFVDRRGTGSRRLRSHQLKQEPLLQEWYNNCCDWNLLSDRSEEPLAQLPALSGNSMLKIEVFHKNYRTKSIRMCTTSE